MSSEKGQIIRLVTGGSVFAIGAALKMNDKAEFIVFLISYLILGIPVILSAFRWMLKGQIFNEFFLMSIATIGAFIIGEYPEGAAVMLFYLIGEMVQEHAVGRSRRSISALLDIRPDHANLREEDGSVAVVPPGDVLVGDHIIVRPGERIPLDGEVVEGSAFADMSALTGEPMPAELSIGSRALSGSIDLNGVIIIRVTETYEDSTVSRILDLVQNAAERKAPTEQFITKFARYYTPAVVLGALLLAFIPPLVIPGAGWGDWVYRALVFLVVSCPCALLISIPLGYFGGIGAASRRGVLVKGSNYLEALNNVGTVVWDKTGTLTKGGFVVTDVLAAEGYTAEDVVYYAAYAESHSNHPIALSVMSHFDGEVDAGRIAEYEEIAGKGIRIVLDGKVVLVGNSALIEYPTVEVSGTAVHVAIDGRYAGTIVVADEVKDDAAEAVSGLRKLGIGRIVMMTGDSVGTGATVARKLGIDEVYAELMPEDKVQIMERIESEEKAIVKHRGQRRKIAFVGDGINDAPVLAKADIGIAMGGLGSDAAIEAADIVLMTDEPSKLLTAMQVAKRTRLIVIQNIVFALGIKAVFLLLGALGVASMWEAVFADMGVALLAIFNAMRVGKERISRISGK
ncbi:MAG: heavy metal translocating P-type ATPase [Eubacteriales bacterium]|nr:heavy metal translocating P-type ATPase [Eubacteriales bacterium]